MARKKKVTQKIEEKQVDESIVADTQTEKIDENTTSSQQTKETNKKELRKEIIYSQAAIDMIKQFTNLHLNAYKSVSGKISIGYGTTVIDNNKPVLPNMHITEEQASDLLVKDIEKLSRQISNLLRATVTQNQFDALVSFAYNIGINQFARSALLRLININDIEGAAKQFIRWNKSGGVEQSGLTRRRIAETDLFCKVD